MRHLGLRQHRSPRRAPLLVGLALAVGWVAGSSGAAACPIGQKIVIDNGKPGYVETGDDWATWSSGGQAIGPDYRYLSHTVGGPDRKGTATWTPSLSVAGIYKVEAVFRATENRTADADYFVHDANGKAHHYVVDQRDGAATTGSHGPVYANLGQHYLAPSKGKLVLDGTDDDHSDEADAAVFTLVSCGTTPPPPTGPCAGIAAVGTYELCLETATTCSGLFTDGSGCKAFCAAANMVCVARFGGSPGCNKELTAIPCEANNGHQDDWCECALPGGTVDAGADGGTSGTGGSAPSTGGLGGSAGSPLGGGTAGAGAQGGSAGASWTGTGATIAKVDAGSSVSGGTTADEDEGCGCRIPGRSPGAPFALLLSAGAIAAVRRLRRPRR